MRIWHEKLIPKLCRQHLLAMWREGLGCYSILVNDKKAYRNHPAVKEFEGIPCCLWERLFFVREEMLNRGYHPKELPQFVDGQRKAHQAYTPWQTLEEQVAVLKAKGCDCRI